MNLIDIGRCPFLKGQRVRTGTKAGTVVDGSKHFAIVHMDGDARPKIIELKRLRAIAS